MENLVRIIMGSKNDLEFCKKIAVTLKEYGVPYEFRVASTHKTPEKVLNIIREDNGSFNLIYVTVAGRSNALSGEVDFNTARPVIACPPYSDKFGGADIFSSLRTPSGSGLVTCLEPEAAAIAAVKTLAVADKNLYLKIEEYQRQLRETIEKDDSEVKGVKSGKEEIK